MKRSILLAALFLAACQTQQVAVSCHLTEQDALADPGLLAHQRMTPAQFHAFAHFAQEAGQPPLPGSTGDILTISEDEQVVLVIDDGCVRMAVEPYAPGELSAIFRGEAPPDTPGHSL